MYVIFVEEVDTQAEVAKRTVRTLDQAFAQIVCRCGLSYRFDAEEEGWRLVMTDVERPDRSPDPIHSTYKKPGDAQHDLMIQAVDGRLRGHVALDAEAFAKARIMQINGGKRVHLG